MIYNDDAQIIDFLADLQDREPLHSLQKFIDVKKYDTMCLLYEVPKDNLVLVLLYMASFDFNEKPNKLALFAHPDMQVLIQYFTTWFDAIKDESDPEYGALLDINCLLRNQWYLNQTNRRIDLPA